MLATRKRVCCKQDFSPEEEQAFRFMLDEYQDALQPLESDIEGWLAGADPDDLRSLERLREEINLLAGGHREEFEVVFREGGTRGAEAGRELARRQFGLEIATDIPSRALDEIDDWVETAAGSTLETITEDSARWLRGAHEEGLSIDDIAGQLNDELFEGRLEDYVAERAARTGTISTSNQGAHSAYEDADSVIAEEWLTAIDGRERDSHAEADGQVVALDTAFEVGDVYGQHPGDPSLPIGEIVNCRCSVVGIFEDDLTDDQLAEIEDGGRVWLR